MSSRKKIACCKGWEKESLKNMAGQKQTGN